MHVMLVRLHPDQLPDVLCVHPRTYACGQPALERVIVERNERGRVRGAVVVLCTPELPAHGRHGLYLAGFKPEDVPLSREHVIRVVAVDGVVLVEEQV